MRKGEPKSMTLKFIMSADLAQEHSNTVRLQQSPLAYISMPYANGPIATDIGTPIVELPAYPVINNSHTVLVSGPFD